MARYQVCPSCGRYVLLRDNERKRLRCPNEECMAPERMISGKIITKEEDVRDAGLSDDVMKGTSEPTICFSLEDGTKVSSSNENVIVINRGFFPIEDLAISEKEHAIIQIWRDGYKLIDCSRYNATWVNQLRTKAYEETVFKKGDSLRFGNTRVTVI